MRGTGAGGLADKVRDGEGRLKTSRALCVLAAEASSVVNATLRKRRWFRANKDKRRTYNQRYYAKNAERLREGVRIWRQSNRDKTQARNNAFRARNPNYQREYRERKKFELAWRKWISGIRRVT
jgi:hypothetical protein